MPLPCKYCKGRKCDTCIGYDGWEDIENREANLSRTCYHKWYFFKAHDEQFAACFKCQLTIRPDEIGRKSKDGGE